MKSNFASLEKRTNLDHLVIEFDHHKIDVSFGVSKTVVSRHVPEFTGTLDDVRSPAAALCRDDLRVAVYPQTTARYDKIRVEVAAPRMSGRRAWKKTRSFYTNTDAIAFIESLQTADLDRLQEVAP